MGEKLALTAVHMDLGVMMLRIAIWFRLPSNFVKWAS